MILVFRLVFFFCFSVFSSWGQVDSINNTRTEYTPFYVNPFEPKILRFDYELRHSDYIVFLSCMDSSKLTAHPFKIPESCQAFYEQNKNSLAEDSLVILYRECINDYYADSSKSGDRDSLYVASTSVVYSNSNASSNQLFFCLRMEIYNEDSTDLEIAEFYSIDELADICITGPYFRSKSNIQWKDGRKHGLWKYFNKNGTLSSTLEYSEGILIREEHFNE